MASFPDYIQDFHRNLLSYPITNTYRPTISASVYANYLLSEDGVSGVAGFRDFRLGMDETYTSPEPILDDISLSLSNLDTSENYSPTEDWRSALTAVMDHMQANNLIESEPFEDILKKVTAGAVTTVSQSIDGLTAMIDSNVLDNLASKFRNQSTLERKRVERRITTKFATLRATSSSAYIFALANVESQFLRDFNDFMSKSIADLHQRGIEITASLTSNLFGQALQSAITNKQQRNDLVNNFSQLIVQQGDSKRTRNFRAHELRIESGKFKYLTRNEWDGRRRESALSRAMFPLTIHRELSALMSAPLTGIASQREEPGKWSSAIGGVLVGAGSGASIGATLGTIAGLPGAVVGAGVGALLGMVSGLLQSS